jgi:hypothetical protein
MQPAESWVGSIVREVPVHYIQTGEAFWVPRNGGATSPNSYLRSESPDLLSATRRRSGSMRVSFP